MLDFLTLKPTAFGLDISDLSLKIIKLKKSGKFFDLASFGETEIKPGIIEGGEIKNEAELARIIKEALKKVKGEKLETNYVVASLPEEKAFLEVIQMPLMTVQELAKAIYFEAENYIPLPIEKVYLDAQTVLPLKNHLKHMDVLLAALPKKTIDSYIASLQEAGLKPLALEIESQAISRAVVPGGLSPFPLLLIDLGANRSSFIVFAGSYLRFTTSLPISAKQFTEAIAKNLKIDLNKAEKLKIKYGIEDSNEGKKNLKAIAPLLADFQEQISKYLDYYQSHSGHEHLPQNIQGVRKIILCGGGTNLKGLADFLSLGLKIPVELGNPWINILSHPLKKIPALSYEESLRYATALGLALRGMNIM